MEQTLSPISFSPNSKASTTQAYNDAINALTNYAKDLYNKGILDEAGYSRALKYILNNKGDLVRKNMMGRIVGLDQEAQYKIYAGNSNYTSRDYAAAYNQWYNEQVKAEQGSDVKADDTIETALAKTGAGETKDVYDEHADKPNTTSTYAGYKPARNSADYPAYDDYEAWVKDSGREDVSYEDWYKARGALDQANAQSGLSPLSGTTQDTDTNTGNTTEIINSGATSQAADLQQAIAQGAQEAQKEAQDSARAAASAGINKQRAGMLGSQSSEQSQTSNVLSGYAANQQQRGATQADYLQKMAQADALDQQASNMKKGQLWNTGAAAIGGAAGGAAVGATMGLSDERAKESPDENPADGVDEDQLREAIKQFKELYRRVRGLK